MVGIYVSTRSNKVRIRTPRTSRSSSLGNGTQYHTQYHTQYASSKYCSSEVQDIICAHREDMGESLIRERLLAEFVGTFFLVLTVGVAVASRTPMAAVAIGLMLAVQVYTFGAVSGGFLNPAVTLAVLLAGRNKVSWRHAVLYVVAQSLGGIVAGLAAFGATEFTFFFDYAALGRPWGTSLELEILFTMCLCLIVLVAGTSNDAPNQYFGFSIGCAVVCAATACGGFDQGSFNPAVTLGINIANYANSKAISGPSAGAWAVFILAPLVGAALAAAVFRGTRGNEYEDPVDPSEVVVPQKSVASDQVPQIRVTFPDVLEHEVRAEV